MTNPIPTGRRRRLFAPPGSSIATLLSAYAAAQSRLDSRTLADLHVRGAGLLHIWFPGRVDRGSTTWRRRMSAEFARLERLEFRFSGMRRLALADGVTLAFGRWACTFRRKDGKAGRGAGPVTLVLRRVSGQWRIAADHFSAAWSVREGGSGRSRLRRGGSGAEAGTRTPKP